MPKVDSKGRIVLPQEVRERLGLDPGTEVDVHEEGGRAVVKPEESPDEIIEDLEQQIEDAASHREQTPRGDLQGEAESHVETIRQQASDADPSGGENSGDTDDTTTDE